MQYKTIGFICRLQPIHNGHIEIIREALKLTSNLVIMIGSTNSARTIKNPFTYKERIAMVLNSIPNEYHHCITFRPLPDNFYDHLAWQRNILSAVGDNENVAIISSDKNNDDLLRSDWLPFFEHIAIPVLNDNNTLNSTDIRNAYFSDGILPDNSIMPNSIIKFLKDFRETDNFNYLIHEYDTIRARRQPIEDLLSRQLLVYDIISQTVDAVVIMNNHVLLVKRKFSPGKDLWAIPGGYLEIGETIQEGIIRELIEETEIDLSCKMLGDCVSDVTVFDYPYRSLLGRVITNAGLITLQLTTLPDVKAADDAKETKWFKLDEIDELENKMFDDHHQILQYFIKLYENKQ